MEKERAKEPPDVTLAFRLGWSLSEFMGQARLAWTKSSESEKKEQPTSTPKELRGFADDEAPRLTFSNRYFSNEGAWWQSAMRIVCLAEQLRLLSEEEDDQTNEAIRALPDQIYAFTYGGDDEELEAASPPRDFYSLLEPWSRKIGTELATQSDQAALAFRAGGQVADTYWFMRGEEHYGEPRDENKQDSWHQLLNHKRLVPIIEEVKRFDRELPPLVGECLRFSLYRWMIAHDLEYKRDRLELVRDEEEKSSGVPREKGGILKQIEPEDEKQIVDRLADQAKVWQELILGTRPPESFLNQRARQAVVEKTVGWYALLIVGATVGLSLLGYLLVVVLGGAVSALAAWLWDILSPTDPQSDTVKTSVEIVVKTLPLVTGAVVFVASLLREGWMGARGSWKRLYEYIREQEIKECTWVPWRQPKET